MKKVLFCWSSGKDSALALAELRRSPEHEIVGLLTTVTEAYDRVSMHGVRRELLLAQAASLGLPLTQVLISTTCTNAEYEAKMQAALAPFQAQGVELVAFGDIFLEDLRRYREEKLALAGLHALFPLWQRPSAELARTLIAQGFRIIVTCVDTQVLAASFAGRDFDAAFLADLPPGVDPCGENGEFHSFVWDGPIFRQPIPVGRGERVLRLERYQYCDLLPAGAVHA